MFDALNIRARVWLIVIVSIVAIMGLSVTLLLQARGMFIAQLEQGAINQVQMMHDYMRGLHQRVVAGEISETEGKRLGRFAIMNTQANERNYMLLYHRIGELLAHPARNTERPLDSEAQVRASLAALEMPQAERMASRGLPTRDPVMPEIILNTVGSSYTGFFEYLYYPTEGFGTRILATMDDEYAHPDAEVRRAYAEHFEPWGWVIVNGLFVDDVNAAFMRWAGRSASIVATILLVLAASAFYLSRSITRPLLRSRDYMIDIAEGSGDLSKRLSEDGHDELSELGRAFNTFVSKLSRIIRQVLETNEDISNKSNSFAQMIERTAQRSSGQMAETEMLASSTTELSSSLSDVAESASTSVDAAREATAAAEKATDAVSRTNLSVSQLSDSLSSIQLKVHEMSSHNQKVNTVLDVIRGIAEQTNLRALNAAIEAARAGEQGRGFAVVADEVRSLAQKTQDSTKEINAIIQQLESNTATIVNSMDEGVAMSRNCADTANIANTLLSSVLQSIALISERNRNIAVAVQQQSEVTEGIARSSVKIAGDGRLNSEDFVSCKLHHDEVRMLVNSLDELMRQFRLG
ncbi:MAG: methyl-accepting chemotaxis protein [Pseudohongiella sp.]|nr:methyl-accepting chemotaxis protein [Pseudohongiella sp.]